MKLRPKKQQLLKLLPSRLVQTRASHGDASRYLTFDDGPDPDYTPRLLDLLAQHGVHASFFLVGHRIEQHPELVERIVAEGHMLGNHSYSHRSFKQMSLQQQVEEFRRTDDLLSRFDNQPHHRLRTPQGYIDPLLLLYYARHARNIVYWSYDSMDYQKPSHDTLVNRLRAEPPRAGDIVLMHDDSDRAIDALAALLPEWLSQGYRFSALPGKAP
jgi:peptidoglycan/xylan/chitin deacetylase (PgdA/CDA1 family)